MLKRLKSVSMMLFLMGASTGAAYAVSNPGITDVKIAQQDGACTGIVKDATGETVIGASVVVKGTTNGTITGIDGDFSLSNVKKGDILQISFVGYITQEVKWNGTPLNIILKDDTQTLEEVVVVGYGTQKKVNLTGAVAMAESDVLEDRPIANLAQGLQGAIPNLNISFANGNPNSSTSINVRGLTSLNGGSALILVDGVETNDISLLNPQDIESISVLKDASSAAVYGARAAFGVVLITTKTPDKDKTSITYSGDFAFKTPTTVPDFVTDGYTYSERFYEAYSAWNNYSATPKNINKSQTFSTAWLDTFKQRKEQGITDEYELGSNGEYIYYGNTDYMKELYKDQTFAQDHNLSVSGSNGKLNYYVSGRYYGYDGLFRYNTDTYNTLNLRAKGSLQVFDWLRIDNNTDYSNLEYHNPLNVGEGGSIWRNIADEGHPSSPLFNPDGSLTMSGAYTIGDFIYGKNGLDTHKRILKNTTVNRHGKMLSVPFCQVDRKSVV